MKKIGIVVIFAILSAIQASSLYAGEKLGKIFIKSSPTTIDGEKFTDQGREDTVEDLKERASKFVVVDSEKEADYLIVVVERSQKDSSKIKIVATISFKRNGQWKPGTRLSASSNGAGLAARRLIGQANDWIESRGE